MVDRGDCFFVEKAWNAQQGGADAVIVVDNVDEPLITMAHPDGHPSADKLVDAIQIPTILISKTVGDRFKDALHKKEKIVLSIDWSESISHPDERVEWELWTTSDDACGLVCDRQRRFISSIGERATSLSQDGHLSFTPHYITHSCDRASSTDPICNTQCIYRGRYCAPDPDDEGQASINGRDVIQENLRQLCFLHIASSLSEPWLWWAYQAHFAAQCKSSEGNFNEECSETAMLQAGMDATMVSEVHNCVGDVDADSSNDLLEAEVAYQMVSGSGRGAVVLLPTVIINDAQYRGRLDTSSVLRALCAGFKETTEPQECLSGELNTDDCSAGSHSCWTTGNFTACLDTFRGFQCVCPAGFTGDGMQCADIDECAVTNEPPLCEQRCINTPGSFACACANGYRLVGGSSCIFENDCEFENGGCEQRCVAFVGGHDCRCDGDSTPDPSDSSKCVEGAGRGRHEGAASVGLVILIMLLGLLLLVSVAYAAYKYRLKAYMDHEVRAIMSEYMPLEDAYARTVDNDDDYGESALPDRHHGKERATHHSDYDGFALVEKAVGKSIVSAQSFSEPPASADSPSSSSSHGQPQDL